MKHGFFSKILGTVINWRPEDYIEKEEEYANNSIKNTEEQTDDEDD